MLTILQGDALEQLRTLPEASVHCCVTSPPYWGLRDYGVAGQIGLEPTMGEYVAKMVDVFADVRRVLRDDGTCWVNLGDTYAGSFAGGESPHTSTLNGRQPNHARNARKSFRRDKAEQPRSDVATGEAKPKDLCGIPWRVAFALQASGWYLRQDIIWHKPNPMPESVTDRCTKAHEYLFLLSKSERYHYDAKAVGEPIKCADRYERAVANNEQFDPAKHKNGDSSMHNSPMEVLTRSAASLLARGYTNKRTVWTIPTAPYAEAHFATYPPDLIKPCILAGCPEGGTVLDPFAGSGTTGAVALELGRQAVLIELNPDYIKLIKKRCDVTPGFQFSTPGAPMPGKQGAVIPNTVTD